MAASITSEISDDCATNEFSKQTNFPDWNYIYHEMQEQAVSSIAFPWLKTHTISNQDLQKEWINSCLQQQARWIQVMHAQEQLISLLEQHGIPCVIIKGSAAMISYPYPSLRAVGDIDFLVKRDDYDKTAGILESNGYHLAHEKDPTGYHYCYERGGVTFELHRRLGIILPTDEPLLSLFEKGIDNRVWHTIGNVKFPSLPDDLNGVVLLFHINHHIRSGLGLRQIIDWMMYVYKHNRMDDLMPIIRITGMEKLAHTVTIMCQKYFGLPTVVEDNGNYPYDELMEYIINQGNFGMKNKEEENKISYISLITRNPIRLFARLQEGGLSRWKSANKHMFLRPFAWIYQIGYIICELFRQKITPGKFAEFRRAGQEQRSLIYKLGLDEDRNISCDRRYD